MTTISGCVQPHKYFNLIRLLYLLATAVFDTKRHVVQRAFRLDFPAFDEQDPFALGDQFPLV